MTATQFRLAAGDFEFHALGAGDGPLVLCLHGFPDYPGTFGAQLEAFAAAGYRAVAPFLRGYHPDTLDAAGSYQTVALANDVHDLIEALGYHDAVLLGHDWGAAIAAAATVAEPARVRALVTAAVPYGGRLAEAFVTDAEQQRRSWYMFFFQMPFAELAVAHDDMQFVRRLWHDWSPGWAFEESDIRPVLDTLARPGVLDAALTYYRCALDPAYQKPELAEAAARIGEPIGVPTLHLHGGTDGCIGADMTAGMADAFSGTFELELLPDAGHFLHREEPAAVNERVLAFLAEHAPVV